jgi:haloacid dehalogenase superfamily, subfamily IA, variant 3 with third motif having DD or ED
MFAGKSVIVFDMDGTLIDSVGVWNDVDRIVIKHIGNVDIDPESCQAQRDILLRQCSAAPNPYLEYCGFLQRKYASSLTAEQIIQLRTDVADELLTTAVMYKKDAEKVLAALKARGLTLVVATTTSRANMGIYRTRNKNIMEKAPLDALFTRIYTREDVRNIKPDPEVYRRVLDDFCIPPEECLVFEDSLVGVEAANSAGIDVVAMYDAYSDEQRAHINERATYRFDTYAAVLALLA